MKTLQLVVPCYNEEAVLKMFYDEVSCLFDKLEKYEGGLIFVDDGSKDATLEIIKALAAADSRVKYISFSRNFGKEAAMLAGLKSSTADVVGILDADLQHSPELIVEMLPALDEGYDVAAAKRSDREGEGKFKSFLSNKFYSVSNRLTEVEIQAGAQDFRLMKRCVVNSVLSLCEHNRFTKGIFSFVGFKTKWFSHENRERAAGSTKWSLKKLLKYAFDGILGFSNSFLRLPLYLGCVFMPFGFLYFLVHLIAYNGFGVMYSLIHPIISLMFFLTGLILFCLGITNEYIGRIYTESKNRPIYIVRETNIDVNTGD